MTPSTPSRSFNPWPWAIIAAVSLFAVSMIGFAIFSTFHRVDLVAADYYERELRYQGQLDRTGRALALGDQVQVGYDAAARTIQVRLPAAHAGASGRIHLYRPSSAGLDRDLPLELNDRGQQTVNASDLPPGPWQVRIEWKVADREFYQDRRVVIPKAQS
jgi:hypothetical protein